MVRIPEGSNTFPRRGAALRGVGVMRQGPSGMVFAKWPKKRGPAKSAAQQQSQDDFKAATVIVKNMDPLLIDFAAEVSIGAPLLPRDLLMMFLYGRGIYIILPSGRKLFSMAAYQDVSLLFDAICQIPGGMFVRGADWWTFVPPGLPGDALITDPTGEIRWGPAVNGGGKPWWREPPSMSPGVTGQGTGNNAFGGTPFLAEASDTVSGLRIWVNSLSGSLNMYPGLYSYNPSTGHLDGGHLLVQGPPVAAVVGQMDLPFTAPAILKPGLFYFMGIGVDNGNYFFAASGISNRGFEWFPQSGHTLPSTAPSVHVETANSMTMWLY